ncbi:Uncharacterized protein TCAP_00518 [Tolypocladium capitatum]|uniref:Uncharacterized protein n=1 Tax=Tolypocladium capitatum TaxID=45235 RepID=A0A2K3QPW9_9HYPO|nr:Uncharacterized protein TCAP_00518 [Tolypocladium capitatum]
MLHCLRAALLDPAAAAASSHHSGSGRHGVKVTHMDELDEVAARHFRDTQAAAVSVSGRSLPLLYKLVSSLVAPPHRQTLLVLDLDGRFDATRLTCGADDLRHVYVQRPARSSPEHLRALVADAEGFMLYDAAAQASRSRQWWGTVVVGGLGAGDITAGWNGWLRVDRDQVQAFALGMSADEALAQRDARQEAVDAAGWAATSPWGGFVFHEG